MKRLIIEQSDEEFDTSHSGNALIGLGLNRFTSLSSALAKLAPSSDDISHGEVIKSYCGLLSQAKSDFVAITQYRKDDFFRESLGNKHVPSEGTMRQRMDTHATVFLPGVSWASVEFLQKAKASVTLIGTGHVPVYIDGTVMDNSNTEKENVSHTYRNLIEKPMGPPALKSGKRAAK